MSSLSKKVGKANFFYEQLRIEDREDVESVSSDSDQSEDYYDACPVTTYVSEDISESFIQSTISKASLLTLNAIESITNLFNYSHDRELTNERNCDAKIQVEKDFDVKECGDITNEWEKNSEVSTASEISKINDPTEVLIRGDHPKVITKNKHTTIETLKCAHRAVLKKLDKNRNLCSSTRHVHYLCPRIGLKRRKIICLFNTILKQKMAAKMARNNFKRICDEFKTTVIMVIMLNEKQTKEVSRLETISLSTIVSNKSEKSCLLSKLRNKLEIDKVLLHHQDQVIALKQNYKELLQHSYLDTQPFENLLKQTKQKTNIDNIYPELMKAFYKQDCKRLQLEKTKSFESLLRDFITPFLEKLACFNKHRLDKENKLKEKDKHLHLLAEEYNKLAYGIRGNLKRKDKNIGILKDLRQRLEEDKTELEKMQTHNCIETESCESLVQANSSGSNEKSEDNHDFESVYSELLKQKQSLSTTKSDYCNKKMEQQEIRLDKLKTEIRTLNINNQELCSIISEKHDKAERNESESNSLCNKEGDTKSKQKSLEEQSLCFSTENDASTQNTLTVQDINQPIKLEICENQDESISMLSSEERFILEVMKGEKLPCTKIINQIQLSNINKQSFAEVQVHQLKTLYSTDE